MEVLLAVESDCLGLNLAVFYIDFVATEDDRDILANTDEIAYNKARSQPKGGAMSVRV